MESMETTHTTQSLLTEAVEMVNQLENGNRSDVREFLANHTAPTRLTLAMLRVMTSFRGEDTLDAVVNLQGLTEQMGDV